MTSSCHNYIGFSLLFINIIFTISNLLTHWGRVTHICVSKITIIGSDNGLSPSQRQAIIRTNAGILLIGPSGTNFSEILIEIITFSFKKMRLKVSSVKWRPCCLGLNVLMMLLIGILISCCSDLSMHILHVRGYNGVRYRSRALIQYKDAILPV